MEHTPYYRDRPDSPVAILMVHGILGTPRHFDWLLDSIPDSITVHNILLKGHGGSVADFSNARMADWKLQVHEALSQLEQTGKPVILVGHSLGSLLAMEAAGRHTGICGLLLLNPPLHAQFRPRLFGMSLRSALGTLRPDTHLHKAYLSACGTRTEPYLWKYFGWIPNFLSLLRLCRASRSLPGSLEIPCHVFLGEDDDLVHIRSAKWFQENPKIRLHILSEGIHFGYTAEEQSQIQTSLKELLSAFR